MIFQDIIFENFDKKDFNSKKSKKLEQMNHFAIPINIKKAAINYSNI